MDYVHYQWVREHVQHELCEFAGLLGAETGKMEKRLREQMHAHVEHETGLLLNLIELQRKNLEGLIEKQAKTIESQSRKIKSLEAMIAKPKKEATATIVDIMRARA